MILTVDEFKQLFDHDRIDQLASDFNRRHGKNVYAESIVQTILDQAEGVIKNSLSRQYTTVQLEADHGIKRMTAEIAMFYLEMRRPPVSAETTRLHDMALKLLKQLHEGTSKLSAVDQQLPSGPSEVPVEAIGTGFFNLTEAEQASLAN